MCAADNAEQKPVKRWTFKVELRCKQPDALADLLIRSEFAEGAQVIDDATNGPSIDGDSQVAASLGCGVVTYVERPRPDAELELRAQLDELQEASTELEWSVQTVERFDDTSWKTRWKEFFEIVDVSDRVTVGPPWESFDASDGQVTLVLNPGMAFGVGTHETTRLACQLLDRHLADASAPSVLDVGCGTAVLAMAAVRLGADPVLGLDIDEDALSSARSNLKANGLEADVTLASTPIGDVPDTFDIVVANILWPTLVDLKDELLNHVEPGGRLILSGIQLEHLDEFEGVFIPADWTVSERLTEGEWAALTIVPDARR
jgi:ribosomal protein L11 methyltransferase